MSTKNDNVEELKIKDIETVEIPTSMPEKKHVKHETITEETVGTPSRQNNTNSQVYKGFALWSKVFAIIGFVCAGFIILVGIPAILAFGLGLIYIALGVFYIFLYNKVMKASKLAKELEIYESNPKEFKAITVELLDNIRSYFKILSILSIIAICVMILGVILFFGVIAAGISSYNSSAPKAGTELAPKTTTINYK